MAEPLFQRLRRDLAAGPRAYRIGWNMRFQRTVHGHSHTFQSEASSSTEKKMISARPTKFSNGTKPTPETIPAVGRVVAVVAHHEEMAGRDDV